MLRKIAAALAFTLWAMPASAAQHEVLILDGAFFPAITHVQPGDTVVFVNMDQRPRRVFGENYGFTSPMIRREQSWALNIVANMRNEYYSKSFHEYETSYPIGEGSGSGETHADTTSSGSPMRGILSYAPPPAEVE